MYKSKYLKYKNKYLELSKRILDNMKGGANKEPCNTCRDSSCPSCKFILPEGKKAVIYGPWIVGEIPVTHTKLLFGFVKVYMAMDSDGYTKMVTEYGVGKAFKGPPDNFDPEKWNDSNYRDAYGNYSLKVVDGGGGGSGGGNSGGGSEGRGRALSRLPPDVMNTILEGLTNKEIIKTCQLNKSLCSNVSWSKLIRDRKINPNSVLNLNGPLPAMCRHITNVSERDDCRMFYNYTKYTKNLKTIACGPWHSMAVKRDGTIVAWGDDVYNQRDVPAGLNNVIAITASDENSMALKSDGTVVGWGLYTVPAGLNNVVGIAAGDHHSMALKSDGTVVSWGEKNYNHQTYVPAGLNNVVAIAAGISHSMALKSDGTVVEWGINDGAVPADLNNVVSIAAGVHHSMALKNDGTVIAWGRDNGRCTVPAGLNNVVSIAAGFIHSIALKSDGTVVAWCDRRYNYYVPAGLNNVVSIAAGGNQSMALKSDGTVVVWGSNNNGGDVPADLIASTI